MTEKFDYVVVGAGALGSSAAYWLTRAGERSVLVLEQFEIGHNRGASEDHSRIIRHAYHSPVYTALTPAAYETWAQVEDESGLSLVTTTGGLDLAIAGTAGEAELDNYRNALDHARIGYDNLTADNVRDRWPQWQVGDDTVGMWQRDGGILDVRRACAVHLALARARGAVVRPHTAVHGIRSSDAGVMLATDAGEISAGYVVLCTASWLPDLLPDLGLTWNITLSQEQVCYFATSNLRDFAPDRFPMWIWHGEPLFYGFPVYGEVAVKAARDMTGRFVTQQTRSFEPDPAETTLVADFLRRRIPGALGPELYSKTCVYDMPPDRDFIIDRVPGHPRIAVGVGAGHAAKFAGVIGKILAELCTGGRTNYPIEAFRADRPALTNTAHERAFRMTGAR